MIIERDVPLATQDGTVLRADVYRPDSLAPVPAILHRVPYDRSHPLVPISAIDPARAVEAGFAFVCQDTRGRYGSEGQFYPFDHEAEDGYATVEWVAAQPWCSGAVGMAGRSYAGVTQWMAAMAQPPHLRAIFPVAIGAEFYHSWIYQGGAFQLGFNMYWAALIAAPNAANRLQAHYRHLPLRDLPLLREQEGARFYFDWMTHPTNDAYWQSLAINHHYDRIQVPAYHVGGWYDVFLSGTLENFARLRREAATEVARGGQRILIGPWAHGSTYGPYPDHHFDCFGADTGVDLAEVQIQFFQRHLQEDRGRRTEEGNGSPESSAQSAMEDEAPPVRLFVMGENRWREEREWPLARSRTVPWFFHSAGDAGSAGGTLSLLPPSAEPPDSYLYDPNDPAPTVGGPTSLPSLLLGTNSGPKDQQRVEARPDVLLYTSAPLEEPLEVTGPLSVVLYAATSAPDTDFVAKLTDVQPDGVSRILAEGVLRARFREGFDRERPVEPGRRYAYSIDLVATSNLFGAGHRIRVAITSSSFPRFDRNPNSGRPLGTDGPEELQPARQTLFHDQDAASHILLPVVPR